MKKKYYTNRQNRLAEGLSRILSQLPRQMARCLGNLIMEAVFLRHYVSSKLHVYAVSVVDLFLQQSANYNYTLLVELCCILHDIYKFPDYVHRGQDTQAHFNYLMV
jgi:hypothetical protein